MARRQETSLSLSSLSSLTVHDVTVKCFLLIIKLEVSPQIDTAEYAQCVTSDLSLIFSIYLARN